MIGQPGSPLSEHAWRPIGRVPDPNPPSPIPSSQPPTLPKRAPSPPTGQLRRGDTFKVMAELAGQPGSIEDVMEREAERKLLEVPKMGRVPRGKARVVGE